VGRDVAEVQVGRQPARDVDLRIRAVAVVDVAFELPVEESPEPTGSLLRSAPVVGGLDGVVDRQVDQAARGEPCLEVRDRPAVGDLPRERRRWREVGGGDRILRGNVRQMLRQRPLEEAAEVVGPRERLLRGAHRQETVPVDDLQPDRKLPGRGGEHPRQHEGRVVVRHDDAGPFRERRQEALPRPVLGLEVGDVEGGTPLERAAIVDHALDHEAVEAVARERVAAAEPSKTSSGRPSAVACSTARSSAKFLRVRRAAIIQ
jgi:hypothetical protein